MERDFFVAAIKPSDLWLNIQIINDQTNSFVCLPACLHSCLSVSVFAGICLSVCQSVCLCLSVSSKCSPRLGIFILIARRQINVTNVTECHEKENERERVCVCVLEERESVRGEGGIE